MSLPPYFPRVAIVTGAAQGIGLSIAQQLAKDGIDVAVNDIPNKLSQINEVVDSIRAIGRKAIALPADVSSEEQVKNMVETTARALGSVDIVRNIQLMFLKFCNHSLTNTSNSFDQMIANAGIGKPTSFLES